MKIEKRLSKKQKDKIIILIAEFLMYQTGCKNPLTFDDIIRQLNFRRKSITANTYKKYLQPEKLFNDWYRREKLQKLNEIQI